VRENPATAREKVDVIGISGMITPSLDEMGTSKGDEARGFLRFRCSCGGATTSRAHTSVKIAPGYNQAVVHVLDASRAVVWSAAF